MSRSLVEAELTSLEAIARDTWVLRYAMELDEAPRPGQFAMVHPGADDEYLLPRPFSILGYAAGELEILVKVVGRGSAALVRAPRGDRFRVFAPLGSTFSLPAFRGRPAILVAGGVGVVPLHMLARELVAAGESPYGLFGGRMPQDLPLPLFERPGSGTWECWVETDAAREWREGRVTVGLEESLERHPDAVVATCGPTAMMQAVVRITRPRGVPTWVCLEEQMGCGAGVCRACVIEDAQEPRMRTVCKEGPVFEAGTIRFLPEERTGAMGRSCP